MIAMGHKSVFPPAEYHERLQRTRARMCELGIEVLVVVSPESLNYLTGYAGWSFYTPQFLVVEQSVPHPTLILRKMDVACAEFTTDLPSASIEGYPEDLINADNASVAAFLADWIVERGWVKRVIGLEKTAFFLTSRCADALRVALTGADIVDAGDLVSWIRLIKSGAEIQVMREAGVLAGLAMEAALDAIEPGVRECDAAARVYAAQIAGSAEFSGGVPMGLALSAGDRTRAPHLSWSDARFQQGQTINIELGGCRHQYHCGLARSLSLGPPSASLASLSRVVIEGMGAARDKIRVGARCEDVSVAWRKVLSSAGYSKASRIGYSIGLGFQPIWVEGTASFQDGDRTELVSNMVFHLICGMWEGEDNFVISETLLVTASGCESLTPFPKKLFIK